VILFVRWGTKWVRNRESTYLSLQWSKEEDQETNTNRTRRAA
jgi:hypothetical protein